METSDGEPSSVGQSRGSYVSQAQEQAHASRESFAAPKWQVEAWVSTYTAMVSGALANVSLDIERITGVAPMSFAELLRS